MGSAHGLGAGLHQLGLRTLGHGDQLGDSDDPDYEGIVSLYQQPEDGQEYVLAYTGVWRMESGCLQLELSDGMGGSVSGSFPVRMDPTGEYLCIEQDWETGVCPPFFGAETSCIDLARTYG